MASILINLQEFLLIYKTVEVFLLTKLCFSSTVLESTVLYNITLPWSHSLLSLVTILRGMYLIVPHLSLLHAS